MKLRINESQMLTEGPGAGYTIKSTITNIDSIDDFTIRNVYADDYYGDKFFCMDIKCKINITVDVDSYWSYYYGSNEVLTDIPGVITDLTIEGIADISSVYDVDPYSDDWNYEEAENALYNIDEKALMEIIEYQLSGLSMDYNFGGGYSHSTYDGRIAESGETTTNDGTTFDAFITDQPVIDWIDKCVLGDSEYREYGLFDEDGTPLDEYFETEEEAKARAEELVNSADYEGDYITVVVDYYKEQFNGDSDFVDSDDVCHVYKEDEEE